MSEHEETVQERNDRLNMEMFKDSHVWGEFVTKAAVGAAGVAIMVGYGVDRVSELNAGCYSGSSLNPVHQFYCDTLGIEPVAELKEKLAAQGVEFAEGDGLER